MRPAVGQIKQGFQKAIAGVAVRHDLLVVRVGFVFLVAAKVSLGTALDLETFFVTIQVC